MAEELAAAAGQAITAGAQQVGKGLNVVAGKVGHGQRQEAALPGS